MVIEKELCLKNHVPPKGPFMVLYVKSFQRAADLAADHPQMSILQ